jgi:TRAP-type C4-dicarboxylate transport system permease small subunit
MAMPARDGPATDGGAGPGKRALDLLFTLCEWIAGLILAVMAAAVFMSVVLRLAGSQALEGLDEVPRYLFVWLVAFGGAAAMHKGEHTTLDYFVNRLGAPARAIATIIVQASMVAVFLYLLKLSFTLVPNSALQSSPGLEIRLDYVFMAVPVGAVLIIIPMVRNILRALAELLWPKRS